MKHIQKFKYLKISILTTIISIINSGLVSAQFFNGSQNHPSVKFRQISRPYYQIIFPEDAEDKAQIVANVLEKAIDDVSFSIGHKPRPISIILQTQTTEANGFVQMAPRRMELYTIPSQEFDFQDWLKGLVIHELRHVVQYDKLVPKLTAPLFEELKLALFGINLPAWFFEGDATVTETVLTEAGRGRQPAFDLVLRTNLLSDRSYSYSKNYLGSFKNFTPNYYTLGYFMTAKLRADLGNDILDKTLSRIAKFPLRPYGFSNSIKKFGGYGTAQLYQKTMSETDSLWSSSSHLKKWKSYTPLNPVSEKKPGHYLFPTITEDNKILALKSSLSEPDHILILDNDKQSKVISIGPQLEPNLSYSKGLVTWDEYRSDERYGKRTFNEINIYNIHTKSHKTLTKKSRSFSPSLSSDGKKIVFTFVDKNGKFNLKEIESKTGKDIQIIQQPGDYTLQTPSYSEDGSKVVMTAVNEKGKTLLIFDTRNRTWEKLFEEERQLIARPVFGQNGIFYKAHYDGIENIYYFDLHTKEKHQVTFSKFGATNASVYASGELISFNDYQADGNNIAQTVFKPSEETLTTKTIPYNSLFLNRLKTQENTENILSDIPSNKYSVKNYNELSHLFYFHSLRPIAEDLDNDARIGFNLISDNRLNTLSSSFGYAYNSSLGANEYFAKLSYKKFYPIFSVNYDNKENIGYASIPLPGNTKQTVPFNWRESKTSFEMQLPFLKNWLNKRITANLLINTSYTQRSEPSLKLLNFKRSLDFPMQYQFLWSYSTLKATRDLAPPFNLSIALSYQHYPFDSRVNGEYFYLKTSAFLPGLYVNHSFQVRYNKQSSFGTFTYNTNIPRARGYAHLTPLTKLNNTFLLDYRFPIAYPDWEIGPLAYIKRFRGGVFTDFENLGQQRSIRSYGVSLSSDLNLLRYYLPNFALDSRFILPAQGNTSKNAIFEIGFTFNY